MQLSDSFCRHLGQKKVEGVCQILNNKRDFQIFAAVMKYDFQ